MRHGPQMLAGVVVIQSLLGLAKSICRQIPNPQGAIGDYQHFVGLRQTVSLRFGKELFAQILHTAARHHGAPTQYARPSALAWGALVQSKTGATISPVPTLG